MTLTPSALTVTLSPQDLPPVAVSDLIHAWQAATHVAQRAALSDSSDHALRCAGIIFESADGAPTHIDFADRDASCWALAVDQSFGLDTIQGLSVCFRLLGLIEQLAEAPWLRPYFSVGAPDGPEIEPAILKTAAAHPLGQDARFNSQTFRSHAERLLGPAKLS